MLNEDEIMAALSGGPSPINPPNGKTRPGIAAPCKSLRIVGADRPRPANTLGPLDYGTPQSFARSPSQPANPLPGQFGQCCPFCGSLSRPVKKPKGDMATLILLMLFFVLPGLLYAIWNDGYVLKCPDCGAKRADL
jgi:hypothetical protein